MSKKSLSSFAVLLFSSALASSTDLRCLLGQETQSAPVVANPSEELALRQGDLADKYKRFEMLMLRMAEFDASENPRRSALLKRALTESKEKDIRLQLNVLARLLSQQKLKRAVDNQQQVRDDLQSLLKLLLSENRADRLKSEQARVRQYIKELERIIRQQRSVQGRTEGGDDAQRLARDQENVAGRADRLAKLIDQNETPAESDASREGSSNDQNDSADGQSDNSNPSNQGRDSQGQGRPGNQGDKNSNQREQPGEDEDKDRVIVVTNDGKVLEGKLVDRKKDAIVVQDDQGQRHEIKDKDIDEVRPKSDSDGNQSKPTEGKDQSGQPSSSPGQQSDSQSGENNQGQQGENQQSQGQQSQGQQSQGQDSNPSQQQQQQSFPGRQRIAEAQQRMKEARQRLEEAKRKQAIEEQEEARRQLEIAKAELEEILRQLREEEIERTLAMLESRFRRMLEMQLKVYDDTRRLGRISPEKRSKQVDIQAGKLSLDERRIAAEADKALLLLKEEGSSVAFPEAVDQMRSDIDQVVDRLARAKVGRITQGLEEDVIAALEEMIEALQKAQQEAEQRRQQQQQQQPGQPQDQPLVDAIAELKMIKALQLRVNKRTVRYSRLLDDVDDLVGQAEDEDLVESLTRLAEREDRIGTITRDIVLGKNK